MTIAEFYEVMDGWKWRRDMQRNDLISHAWLNAKLTWAKDIPPLQDLLNAEPKKEQTDEQMLAVVKLLNAAFGGKVVEV